MIFVKSLKPCWNSCSYWRWLWNPWHIR